MEFDIHFPLFEEILVGRLRPERPENKDGYHYTQRLQKMITEHGTPKGVFAMVYFKPISQKCAYYHRLLVSETTGYCNDLWDSLPNKPEPAVRSYRRKQLLEEHLPSCLMRIGETIEANNYRLDELEHPSPDADRERLTAIYVYHLLKVCVAKAYLEVQAILADVVAWKQTEDSLYYGFVKELPPVMLFLKRTQTAPAPAAHAPKQTETKKHGTDALSPPPRGKEPIEYLTSQEVCDMLRLSESTLYRYKGNEDFPHPIKIGRKDKYLKKEIETYLASLRTDASSGKKAK
jgi:predicted DNA-binding transcriptional regulator AlpA